MLVADTSALVSLATADTLDLVLEEFDVHTTDTVVEELETTAEYDDVHGDAARDVVDRKNSIAVHQLPDPGLETSRIDAGEASCARLCEERDADFLVTDDLRALPELQHLVACRVAISPIVLRALVKRDRLDTETALERVETMAETRDWFDAPIYRRARDLFQE